MGRAYGCEAETPRARCRESRGRGSRFRCARAARCARPHARRRSLVVDSVEGRQQAFPLELEQARQGGRGRELVVRRLVEARERVVERSEHAETASIPAGRSRARETPGARRRAPAPRGPADRRSCPRRPRWSARPCSTPARVRRSRAGRWDSARPRDRTRPGESRCRPAAGCPRSSCQRRSETRTHPLTATSCARDRLIGAHSLTSGSRPCPGQLARGPATRWSRSRGCEFLTIPSRRRREYQRLIPTLRVGLACPLIAALWLLAGGCSGSPSSSPSCPTTTRRPAPRARRPLPRTSRR